MNYDNNKKFGYLNSPKGYNRKIINAKTAKKSNRCTILCLLVVSLGSKLFTYKYTIEMSKTMCMPKNVFLFIL